jgi:hypothetical protein
MLVEGLEVQAVVVQGLSEETEEQTQLRQLEPVQPLQALEQAAEVVHQLVSVVMGLGVLSSSHILKAKSSKDINERTL